MRLSCYKSIQTDEHTTMMVYCCFKTFLSFLSTLNGCCDASEINILSGYFKKINVANLNNLNSVRNLSRLKKHTFFFSARANNRPFPISSQLNRSGPYISPTTRAEICCKVSIKSPYSPTSARGPPPHLGKADDKCITSYFKSKSEIITEKLKEVNKLLIILLLFALALEVKLTHGRILSNSSHTLHADSRERSHFLAICYVRICLYSGTLI